MGAKEINESFFENEDEIFENKAAELLKIRTEIDQDDETPHEEVEKKIYQLHAYCEITERVHPEKTNTPDEIMPGWGNIRDGCALK